MNLTDGVVHSKRIARILLVDDDAELLQGLTLSLEHEGYGVRSLSRGERVLDEVARYKPSLIVLDVMMPGVDGWEVLRRVRQNPSTQTLPLIMLTAKGSEAARVTGFSMGADDYITKPFSLQEFRCRVAAVLRRASEPGHQAEADASTLPVTSGISGTELIRVKDVYYVEGIRNYTYVHTYDGRFLSRLPLGRIEERCPSCLMRIHRSYVANVDAVRGYRWATKSSFRIRVADLESTELPVSRTLVREVQRRIGVR